METTKGYTGVLGDKRCRDAIQKGFLDRAIQTTAIPHLNSRAHMKY